MSERASKCVLAHNGTRKILFDLMDCIVFVRAQFTWVPYQLLCRMLLLCLVYLSRDVKRQREIKLIFLSQRLVLLLLYMSFSVYASLSLSGAVSISWSDIKQSVNWKIEWKQRSSLAHCIVVGVNCVWCTVREKLYLALSPCLYLSARLLNDIHSHTISGYNWIFHLRSIHQLCCDSFFGSKAA